MEWQKYGSPVHPKFFFKLASTLLVGAFFLFATLLVYLINKPKNERSLSREFLLALMCAVWSGFGFVFFSMHLGNYL